MEPVEFILRTLAVAVTVVLACLLARIGKHRPAAWPGAMFCLAVAAFVITSGRGASNFLGIGVWPLTALCVTKGVWFWLFATALFNQTWVVRPFHFGLVIAVVITGTWQQLVFLERFSSGTTSGIENIFGFGFDAALGVFVVLAIRTAWNGLDVDLVEGRRRLRIMFLIATGCYLTTALGIQSHNILMATSTAHWLVVANLGAIIAAASSGIAALLQMGPGRWLEPAKKSAPPLNRIEHCILEQLKAAMDTSDIFLADGLTISKLAAHLNTQEHILRRAINRGLGYKNFNDFLNDRRIRAACKELAQSEKTRTPVVTIAMNVGYRSVGTFNRAFKARTGMTPTDYRQRHLSAST